MSSPDDFGLGDMFKHLNFGSLGGMEGMMRTLVRNIQINTLKHMRKIIDENIKKLTATGPASPDGLDPYEILGVEQSATRDEIDKAYKKKAWSAHPDRGGNEMEMVKVNAAYEAIKQFRGWK